MVARKKPFQNPHTARLPTPPSRKVKEKKASETIALTSNGKDTFGYFVVFTIGDSRYRFEVDYNVMERVTRLAKRFPGRALSMVKGRNNGWEMLS